MRRAAGRLALVGAAALGLLPGRLRAQDTSHVEGVRVGITYAAGIRPGLLVLWAPGLDSVGAIIQRDLDYSDQFEMIPGAVNPHDGPVNDGLYRGMGAAYAVEVTGLTGAVDIRLHDLVAKQVRQDRVAVLPGVGAPDFRMAVHRVADEIVRWITGQPGIAATQILYDEGSQVFRMDADGAARVAVTRPGERALSPAWSPDGTRMAFTALGDGVAPVIVQTLATGARVTVPGTATGENITPVFTPDGQGVAYAKASEAGTDLYVANVAQMCCVQRLTVGRYSDNLSPTFSPDGQRVAFVSNRPGVPQVYVMAPDGTGQELFAPFDFGATGDSYAPDWSPDGASVVFHREVSGTPQVFVLDVASRKVRQLTSAGRNEDASWAPDGRHVVFVSDRSGRRQLWVVDVESGRFRELATAAAARLPAWSRRLAAAAPVFTR
ncbi:MAG TPA: LpqB family beta-propeller domain-containing protein [Gemmatimonadales bacterium]|nr:LpqB family beta-propeller domain-containing protein [Gemmatimonadales bacterium]